MDISLLDIGLIKAPNQSLNRIEQLFDIAPIIEELGYKRIWLGEHHENDCAWRSPEILISLLLGLTDKIKIGSAGNLIFLHNILRLAQNYCLLESIFTGRVDLGIAAGSADKKVQEALLNGNLINPNSYEERIVELFNLFNYPYEMDNTISIPPYVKGFKPNVWILSTSNSRINIAIKRKCNYVWSLFHTDKDRWPDKNSIIEYNDRFFNIFDELPETAIAVAGICLNDSKKANKIAQQSKVNLFPTIYGNKEECLNKLFDLLNYYKGVKEIVICDLANEKEDRIESCTLFKEIVLNNMMY